MKYILRIICVVTLVSSGLALAGPFGLEMGTPLKNLSVIKAVDQQGTYAINVPNPNSEFELYEGLVTLQDGLCKIIAVGVDHAGDSEGNSIRSTFIQLKAILNKKYGNSTDFDFLHADSVWSDPGDFAMALKQNERSLASFWDTKSDTLPDNISDITLEAKATSSDTTYVLLSYEFNNFDICEANADAKENGAL